MYRIDIEAQDNIDLFLSVNDTEYIDLIIDGDSAKFVSDTREIFAFKSLPVINVDEERNFSARLPRKLLASFLSEGYLQIYVTANELTLQFFEIVNDIGVERVCSVTITRQNIFTGSYTDRLRLLQNLNQINVFDASNIVKLAKIGSQNKCTIDCNCGVACLNLSNTFKMFKKIEDTISFSVSANSFQTLLRVNSNIFQCQNYLCAENKGLVVLCNTIRGNYNESYSLILDSKASFKADIDLTYLIRVLSKIKLDSKEITLDLNKQVCNFSLGNRRFDVPVMTKNLIKSNDKVICNILFPVDVLLSLSKIVQTNIIHIENKRTFTQLDSNDFTIVFRG